MALAIDGYGVGDFRYQVVRLWFGLTPETQALKSPARHKLAYQRYNDEFDDEEDEISLDTFRTHRADEYYAFLTKRLSELYAAAQAVPSKPHATSVEPDTSSLRVTDRDRQTPTGSRTQRPTKKLFFLGFLVVALGSVIAAVLLRASTASISVPPRGSIVNTWTGRIASRVPPGTPPGAELYSANQIVTACDLSAGLSCDYEEPKPINARPGDIIEFHIMLYNVGYVTIRYLQLQATWYPKAHSKTRLEVHTLIQWPLTTGGEVRQPDRVNSISVQFPVAGNYGLVYIPKSTTLTRPGQHFLYRLPDGILSRQDAKLLPGIGLEDVGAPASCLECINAYIRIVSFRARVT